MVNSIAQNSSQLTHNLLFTFTAYCLLFTAYYLVLIIVPTLLKISLDFNLIFGYIKAMQLKKVYCPNKKCRDYGKKGIKNISVIDRYGKRGYRLLKCKTCSVRFSERRWTIFFGFHTDESIIKEALISLLGGKSIRETAKEIGLDKDTVQRIWKRVVESWDMAIEEFLEDLNLQNVDFEDLMSFPPENLWRAGINRRKKKTGIYWLRTRVET